MLSICSLFERKVNLQSLRPSKKEKQYPRYQKDKDQKIYSGLEDPMNLTEPFITTLLNRSFNKKGIKVEMNYVNTNKKQLIKKKSIGYNEDANDEMHRKNINRSKLRHKFIKTTTSPTFGFK